MDRFVVRLGDDQSSATCSGKRLCLDNVGYSTPLSLPPPLFSSLSLSLSLSPPFPLFPLSFGGEAEHSGGETSPPPPPLDETLRGAGIEATI